MGTGSTPVARTGTTLDKRHVARCGWPLRDIARVQSNLEYFLSVAKREELCGIDVKSDPANSGVTPQLIAHQRRQLAHLAIVQRSVVLECEVGFFLRGIVRVRVVQQVLDPEEQLLDGDAGLPALVLRQYAEADGAAGVDVGVEDDWRELTLGRLVRVLVAELHRQLEAPSLPQRLGLARYDALPEHDVLCAISAASRLGHEAMRVVLPP